MAINDWDMDRLMHLADLHKARTSSIDAEIAEAERRVAELKTRKPQYKKDELVLGMAVCAKQALNERYITARREYVARGRPVERDTLQAACEHRLGLIEHTYRSDTGSYDEDDVQGHCACILCGFVGCHVTEDGREYLHRAFRGGSGARFFRSRRDEQERDSLNGSSRCRNVTMMARCYLDMETAEAAVNAFIGEDGMRRLKELSSELQPADPDLDLDVVAC